MNETERAPIIAFACGLLLFVGFCGEPPRAPENRTVHPDDVPLVFIPGLMGSVLQNGEDTDWLTASQALGFSTPDLRLPLEWDGAIQARDALQPAGALDQVNIVFGIGQDVYAPWLAAAAGFDRRPLHVFGYDWRRDNSENAAAFETFLEEIQGMYGGKKAQVVAHSMGGIITLAVLNRRADLIDRVVFVGVPFRGGIGYLDNMYLGTEIALNDALLGPDVIFSHTSNYQFYPAGADFENRGLVQDENGQDLDVDFFDLAVWRKMGWGPFAPENAGWMKERDETRIAGFLEKVLERGRLFRGALKPTRETYPPALVVTSKTHDTLRSVRRRPRGADGAGPPAWDFEAAPKVAGDGSVTYGDTLPPEPIDHEVFLSEYSHSALLNDPLSASAVEAFLKQ